MIIKNLKIYLVGLLLYIANTQAFSWTRFYELKSDLCNRFGKYVGEDLQYIEKSCWSCDGTGIFTGGGYFAGRACYNCNDGIYEKAFVRLARYEVGGFEFHKPIERVFGRAKAEANIIGLIKHEAHPFHLGYEAEFILYLLFDREKFNQQFGTYSFCYFHKGKPQVIMPIVFASITYFKIRRNIPERIERLKNQVKNLFVREQTVKLNVFDDDHIPF